MFTIRQAKATDYLRIFSLYKKVAASSIGIARSDNEITEEYIQQFMNNAAQRGIELIIENPENKNEIIAEIHCYALTPKVFSHVLSELTIVVDPDFHRKGLGKIIFSDLLSLIENTRTDILRIELIARESNTKAIELYKKLGFTIEGKLERRIKNHEGVFEADIPMAWFNKNYTG